MKILKRRPVAKFYYKGHHSHPVRRTVLLVRNTSTYLFGFEIRAGNETFSLKTASIKRYNKSKIAKVGDYCRIKEKKKYQDTSATQTTLERLELLEVINNS